MFKSKTKQRQLARLVLPLLTPHPYPCGDCGGILRLVIHAEQPVYECENKYRTGCRGIGTAHPNGKPAGIPIDQAGRVLRTTLHSILDPYWLNAYDKKAKRILVYDFMYKQFGAILITEPDGVSTHFMYEFHIGYMLHEDLKEAIELAQRVLPKEFG